MTDLEEQLERHLHLVAGRAEPIPDVQAVFADEPQRRSMTSQLSRRSRLPAAAAVVVVVVGVVGMAAMSDLRSPSGADEPSATVATSPDNTSEVSAGPVEVPGMTSVRSSESTAESSVFAQSLLVLLADEYPELELREDATRTTESGHEVTWVYLLDGERRLFVVAGKSGLLDTTGLRRTADGFEWPNEAGIVTTAVSNAGSIAIVRSESIDPDGQARTIDDVHRIAELAASLPTPVSPAPVAPSLDLDGVPPVSAPLVLSQYLNDVQIAVRNDVGDDVFGGAIAQDADTAAMTLTIFGTDADAVITRSTGSPPTSATESPWSGPSTR